MDTEILKTKDLDNYVIFRIPNNYIKTLEITLTLYDSIKDSKDSVMYEIIYKRIKEDINSIFNFNSASYYELIDLKFNKKIILNSLKTFYNICNTTNNKPKDNILFYVGLLITALTTKEILKYGIDKDRNKLIYVIN